MKWEFLFLGMRTNNIFCGYRFHRNNLVGVSSNIRYGIQHEIATGMVIPHAVYIKTESIVIINVTYNIVTY